MNRIQPYVSNSFVVMDIKNIQPEVIESFLIHGFHVGLVITYFELN